MRWTLVGLALALAACGRTSPYKEPQLTGTPIGQDGDVTHPTEVPIDPKYQQDAPQGCTATSVDEYPLKPFDRKPIDVLFLIDDSPSMGDDQIALGKNFDSFFASFKEHQIDFHLGVVTTDMSASDRSGRLVAPYLTNLTPNLDQAFRDLVYVGDQGSAIEEALGAARAALRPPLSTSTNQGFVRPEADFALVFFGDEDDQSDVDIPSFVQEVKDLKSGAAVTVGAIIGLDTGLACLPIFVDNWRLADFARRFDENGVVASCTQDYQDVLRSIAGRLINSRCIIDLKRPLDDHRQVRVMVNGQVASYAEQWPDATSPNGRIEVVPCPEAGGTVDIIYDDCK